MCVPCISRETAGNHGLLLLAELQNLKQTFELKSGNEEHRQFILKFTDRSLYGLINSLTADGLYSLCVEINTIFERIGRQFEKIEVEDRAGDRQPLMSVLRRKEGKNVIFECFVC
jgi:hypothetical protein